MADTTFTFIIEEKLLRLVEKVAEKHQRSIAGELRYLLEELVEKEAKDDRD